MSETRQKKDEYQKALSAYGQAVKLFRKGDFAKAVESFEAFIEKFPGETEVVDRARSYIAIAQKNPKRENLPLKTFDDCCLAAVVMINEADYEDALKILEKALEFKEKEGRAYYLMADAYSLMGDTDNTLEYLKRAIQKDKFFSILAQNEPDFTPVWEDKKFKLITRLA